MKVVFMGTPEFSVPILEELVKHYEVVLVITQADKTVGRKQILTSSPVGKCASDLGLKTFKPVSIKDDYEPILNANADILITAAYGQFVPTKVLKTFKKCINVHGSLLPKRRGGAPIQRAIIEGDKKTGVTIMEMVKKMDAGRMYAKRELEILDSDTQDSVFEKLSYIGRDLLIETLPDIINGKNEGIMQDDCEATISPNILPSEEIFNFKQSARDIFNKIRGLSHEPGAYFVINNIRVKVYESKIVEDKSIKAPGTIIDAKKHLIIKCLDDAIEILTLKVEGKKELKTRDFLNGQKLFIIDEIVA